MIENGTINIISSRDAISAATDVLITDGDISLISGGGGNRTVSDMVSAKGIKGVMNSGFIVAAGTSGMAQTPGTSSKQYALLINFAKQLDAGTLFHIQNSDGKDILSFTPKKKYQSVSFSSSDLQKGETYDVYYGGSSTGSLNDGLYKDGTYTPGTKYSSFTISSVVTKLTIR